MVKIKHINFLLELAKSIFDKYIYNDDKKIKIQFRKLLSTYSRFSRNKLLHYFYKWKFIITLKKKNKKTLLKNKSLNQLYFINPNDAFNRLYEDAKYKQSYLSALKLLYQLKENENCPFHPKINKGNFNFYNDNSFLLNNKISQFNRVKRNCLTNTLEKSNSSINVNYEYNNSISYNVKKNKEKSIFNSGNSSFYNTLTKSISPLSLSNKYLNKNDNSKILYSNNFSDLNSKLTFHYNQYRSPQTEKQKNIPEGILAGRISKNINTVPIDSNEQLFLNSFNNVSPPNEFSSNSAKNARSKFSIIYNKNLQSNSDFTSQSNNNSNNYIIYEDKDKNKNENNIVESYKFKENKNKSHNILKLDTNNNTYEKKIKNSANISNSTGTNDKYSLVCEQLSVRAAYNRDDHITLQSIPDENLLFYANNYLESDESLERFQLNRKKK